jgi:multiple sugar transport system permease protein
VTTATTRARGLQRTRSFRALEPTRGGLVVRYIWLSIAAVLCFFPFYAMVVLSLKPGLAVQFPQSLLPWNLSTASYEQVLGGQNVLVWLGNTLIYAVVSVAAVLLLSAMAGYAFAKKRFRGKETMFWSFLAMVMVPFHVTLIPTFIVLAKLGGVDTYWGLILPTLANAQAVFLMRQFIQGLPDELFEAARIDGAGEFRIFLTIVLPLCKPVLATLGIFVFLWHWNDFLWPLIMGKSSDMWTLTVGIASLQQQNVPLSVMLAGSVVALVPIFFAYSVAQRYVQEGVTSAGIKG